MLKTLMRIWVICCLVLVPVQLFATEKVLPKGKGEVVLSYAPLVKQAAPAVVNIYTKKKVKVRSFSPFFSDPLFEQFFGKGLGRGFNREKIQSSLGSGVIVSGSGLIITSHHVIKGSDTITVVLADKREFDAKILLEEQKTDLALLQIDPGKGALPYLPIGDSDALEVGDLVMAIGNPFGIGQTVTSGIVSAVARTTVGVTDYQFFIQTDAAINPGNSGGALVNMQGEMVGVNTAIFSKSGGSHGLGFAIPTNMVKALIRSSETGGGKVVRPWLGVSMQSLTQEIANNIGLKRPSGALVNRVYPKGPAARGGLKVGDVVLKVDGNAVQDEHAVRFRIATYDIGNEVPFTVLRNRKKIELKISMEAPLEIPKRDAVMLKGVHPLSGLTVENISPAVADELDIDLYTKGVVVSRVMSGNAASLGLRRRDIIKKVNGTDIADTKQLAKMMKKGSLRWQITVQRGKRLLNITWGR